MAGPGPRGEAGAGCGALRGAEGGALLVAAAPAPGSAGSNPRLEEGRPSQPAPGLGERVSLREVAGGPWPFLHFWVPRSAWSRLLPQSPVRP